VEDVSTYRGGRTPGSWSDGPRCRATPRRHAAADLPDREARAPGEPCGTPSSVSLPAQGGSAL